MAVQIYFKLILTKRADVFKKNRIAAVSLQARFSIGYNSAVLWRVSEVVVTRRTRNAVVRFRARGFESHTLRASKKPLLSTNTREVFSCIFGEKQAKYGEIGLRSGRLAALEPDFLLSKAENG